MKTFQTQANIGKARHVVSFHDGVKTHPDNSPFFDVRIFSRKPDMQRFVAELVGDGYARA